MKSSLSGHKNFGSICDRHKSMATVALLVRKYQLHVDGADVEPLVKRSVVVVALRNLPAHLSLAGLNNLSVRYEKIVFAIFFLNKIVVELISFRNGYMYNIQNCFFVGKKLGDWNFVILNNRQCWTWIQSIGLTKKYFGFLFESFFSMWQHSRTFSSRGI